MSSDINNLTPGAAAAGPGVAGDSRRRYRYSDAPAGPVASEAVAALPRLSPGIAWNPIWTALGVFGLVMGIFYYAALTQLIDRWISDAGWSHGFVVPLISVFFIRIKWETLVQLVPQGTWLGLLVLAVGVGGQICFRASGLSHMSMLSFITSLYGIVLFVFGWDYLKALWLPVGYLIFALPPPTPLYVQITTPMQMVAAEFGVHLFPLFGLESMRNGTVIDLTSASKSMQLNVEQACSGMRMLVAFFALAVALAYSTPRPTWQKLTLACCALPIAIICNGLRVTMTGVLAIYVDEDWAKGKAHEYFGLLMLGPALLMQLGVAWILDRIFIEDERGEGAR